MSARELRQSSILRISDVKTLQLLALYQREECLWNTRAPDYRVRARRAAAAARVARALDIPHFRPKHVLIKFKNLRNSYCQELKKIAASRNSGLGHVYRPKVFWFHKMDAFLRPHLQNRLMFPHEEQSESGDFKLKTELEDSDSREGDGEGAEVEWLEMSDSEDALLLAPETSCRYHSEDGLHSPASRCATNSQKKCKRKRSEEPAPTPPPAACDPLLTSPPTMRSLSSQLEALAGRRDDPFDSFGKYIACLLRTMPPERALALQPRIVSLVTSAARDTAADSRRTHSHQLCYSLSNT